MCSFERILRYLVYPIKHILNWLNQQVVGDLAQAIHRNTKYERYADCLNQVKQCLDSVSVRKVVDCVVIVTFTITTLYLLEAGADNNELIQAHR